MHDKYVPSHGRCVFLTKGGAIPLLLNRVKVDALQQPIQGGSLQYITKANVVGGITTDKKQQIIPDQINHQYKHWLSSSGGSVVDVERGGHLGSLLSSVVIPKKMREGPKRGNIKFQPF